MELFNKNNIIIFISILYFLSSILIFTKLIFNSINKTHQIKALTILNDEIKGFKHDLDNIIATIGGYISLDDLNGLKKYYKSIQKECQTINNLFTLSPNIVNNAGIYNLLNTKYLKANKKDIKINLEFFVDLNEFNINFYEFSRILGILLDNAIEAASECEEKVLNIKFLNERTENKHIVIIENTYAEKNIDTKKIFNKGVSGKSAHSGIGLWEVKQFINKSKNLNLLTSKTNKFFSQQFEIYYN
jgi:two-component system sensor histidine kinase AgrC